MEYRIFVTNGETMKLNLTLKWMVLLVVGLMATQASAEQPLILKTQKDKQSYAMGVELFRNWKQTGSGLRFGPCYKRHEGCPWRAISFC